MIFITKIMSKLIYNKIIAKLKFLDEYQGYLKDIQKVNRQSFLKDYHFFGSAERYLQLSIEIVLDISKLLVIAYDLPRPENNEEIFELLKDKGVISSKLFEKTRDIYKFRNILVHVYEKINRSTVYDKLQNNLDDFKDFKTAILKII